MAEFSNEGKVSLWTNESANPKAPKYKGKLYAHRDIARGEEVSVSIWENNSDNPKAPALRGNVEDKRAKNADGGYDWKAAEDRQREAAPPAREAVAEDFNDDCPF